MSLTRKRTKELKRLRASAEELWSEQQALMDRANKVAKEARRQAGHYTREEVAPRVREGYDQYVRPRVEDARSLAKVAGDRVERNVLPLVGNALGTALSVADIAQDARVKAAAKRLGVSTKTAAKKSSGRSAGRYIAIGFAAAAAAGLAYAVWQTFRADDELWVADDEPSDSASGDAPAAE